MTRRRTILVVDAAKAVRTRLREALEPEGHQVLEATDGWGAMWLVESHAGPIDLVITEAGTPFLSGPLFAKRLGRYGGKPHILFVSGHDQPPRGGGVHRGAVPAPLLEM